MPSDMMLRYTLAQRISGAKVSSLYTLSYSARNGARDISDLRDPDMSDIDDCTVFSNSTNLAKLLRATLFHVFVA